jgi:hypothetical protein
MECNLFHMWDIQTLNLSSEICWPETLHRIPSYSTLMPG